MNNKNINTHKKNDNPLSEADIEKIKNISTVIAKTTRTKTRLYICAVSIFLNVVVIAVLCSLISRNQMLFLVLVIITSLFELFLIASFFYLLHKFTEFRAKTEEYKNIMYFVKIDEWYKK